MKYPDYDIMLYGTFCTPCLFGENAHSVHGHPSCVSYALAYSLLALSSNMVGGMIGSCFHDPSAIVACSSLWTSVVIGIYAGYVRTEIREKHGIYGTKEGDVCIHFLCSPCGVCNEAQCIRDASPTYVSIPETQIMMK